MDRMVRVLPKELLCVSIAFLAMTLCNARATDNHPQNDALPSGKDSGSPMTVPITTVGTLRPTFQWSAPNEPGVSYDFIICVGVLERHGFWLPGKKAYYRGDIKTTTHTVEQPLLPDTMYVWSVRTRSGNKVSKWAAYSDRNPSLFRKGKNQYNILCPFKTPAH
jgi:hypothetical protein